MPYGTHARFYLLKETCYTSTFFYFLGEGLPLPLLPISFLKTPPLLCLIPSDGGPSAAQGGREGGPMVVGRPTTNKIILDANINEMDHREHARLAAIVSRRRKQLANLEQQAIDVARQLDEDERELARLRMNLKSDCYSAAKALRQCATTKRDGNAPDPVCTEAGKALKMCRQR